MKTTVMVADIVADLDQGMPDVQLMKKYELSPEGLGRPFANLLRTWVCRSSKIDPESAE